MESLIVNFQGVEIEVQGYKEPYTPATYLQPAEGGGFEIEKLLINGADVTDLLGRHINEISNLVLEEYYS